MKIVLKVEDLKNEVNFVVSFEDYDDMFLFMSKYNPLSIHVDHMSIYYDD